MLKSPTLYGVGTDYTEDDGAFVQKRADIAHCRCVTGKLSFAEVRTRLWPFSEHGAGPYCFALPCDLHQHLRSIMTSLELFQVSALSNEFKLLPVSVFVPPINRFLTCSIVGPARGKFSLAFASIKLIYGLQEKLKLAKLLERVSIPVKETVEDPPTRSMSFCKLTSHSSNWMVSFRSSESHKSLISRPLLVADMVFVQQSAGR
jgi:pre-mRNA-splicing helicase BRR2